MCVGGGDATPTAASSESESDRDTAVGGSRALALEAKWDVMIISIQPVVPITALSLATAAALAAIYQSVQISFDPYYPVDVSIGSFR